MTKQRVESAGTYEEAGRLDLSERELEEIRVIEEFLPKMLTEEEVRIEVLAAITQTGANSAQDMGKVMGVLSSKLAGKADGRIIALLVKEELSKI